MWPGHTELKDTPRLVILSTNESDTLFKQKAQYCGMQSVCNNILRFRNSTHKFIKTHGFGHVPVYTWQTPFYLFISHNILQHVVTDRGC